MADATNPEAKKVAAKKTTKPAAKKPVTAKATVKKVESKKTEPKKTEAKKTTAKAVAKPAEAKVAPKPKVEAKVEAKKAEPKPEAKVQVKKPDAKTVVAKVAPKPKVEAKVEPKAEVKVETKPEPKAEVKAQAKVAPKPIVSQTEKAKEPVAASVKLDDKSLIEKMNAVLKSQQALSAASGQMTVTQRQDILLRLEKMIQAYADRIVDVLNEDFGSRSKVQSMASDVLGNVTALKHARKNLKKWMKPQRRSATFPFGLLGGSARVESHAYGTVGVISPWNFPFYLTFSPLAGIIAAGNRAMIKTSELTPKSAELMQEMVQAYFDESEIAIFSGGPEIGAAFVNLNFDHILYTGGGRVGKLVMHAAAEKLMPVTLELGGKSPVIIGKSADMEKAAKRIMLGKTFNAGQICLAPDYVMVPNNQLDSFVSQAKSAVGEYYEDLLHNEDYTSIVNQGHFDRINGLIDDAKAKGGEVVPINPKEEDFSQQPHRKIPPTLVINPTDDMEVMKEEIFGPVLPVVGYDHLDEVIGKIQDREKPLGLYYFGEDKQEERQVLNKTQSGGVTVNDVLAHIQQEDLPFGGVGPSGIGAYHGYDGFLNFSHQRSIYKQSPVEKLVGILRPPYDQKIMDFVKKNSGIKETS